MQEIQLRSCSTQSYKYYHLDVFSGGYGGGNHLGVVVDAIGWSDQDMQRYAKYTNLVETTFILPPTKDDSNASECKQQATYKVRIFTPTKEIPFAGHPSIGSAHAFLESNLRSKYHNYTNGTTKKPDSSTTIIYQECGAGILPLRIEESEDQERCIMLLSPQTKIDKVGLESNAVLPQILDGIELGQLPPAFVSGGRNWWMAEFKDESSVRNWKPNHDLIKKLALDTNSMGLCIFARSNHYFNNNQKTTSSTTEYDLVVRAFPAGVSIVEDPASGAANGLIASYIAHQEPNGPLSKGYRVSQGREMGHDAILIARMVDNQEKQIKDIWIGGTTNTIVEGTVNWNVSGHIIQ